MGWKTHGHVAWRRAWLALPGWSWARTQSISQQQTSVFRSNLGIYQAHQARLQKAKPWICERSRSKKFWDIYNSSQPLGLLSGLCAASFGNANYILVTRLPHFLLPWRRISQQGSGWKCKPVRNMSFHKVTLIQWNRELVVFAFENETLPSHQASSSQSLPLERSGLGPSLPGRWTMEQTFLSFCDILFVLIGECINFLNGPCNPKLVILGSRH